jgi:hypothetical protein
MNFFDTPVIHHSLDLMIRMSPMQLPSRSQASIVKYLLPDGLEHPRFKMRKSGGASYIVCWKGALELFAERGENVRAIRVYPCPAQFLSFWRHIQADFTQSSYASPSGRADLSPSQGSSTARAGVFGGSAPNTASGSQKSPGFAASDTSRIPDDEDDRHHTR